MKQWDRTYRFYAGKAGQKGFEIGETSQSQPMAIHIAFQVQKADVESPNSAKITLWDLNDEHLSALNEKDCIIVLRAGYGTHMPLVFVGAISSVKTSTDSADRMTEIEAVDGRIELRDSYISVSYKGKINTKKIIEDIAKEMGVTLEFSYNAKFYDYPKGFSYIGAAKNALEKACASSGLSWSLQNGILQVKMESGTMSREVFQLDAESGLIDIPKKITLGAKDKSKDNQAGWEVEYLMNAAIGVNDYVRLESERVKGYYRVYSVDIEGDNLEGSWTCTAKLFET